MLSSPLVDFDSRSGHKESTRSRAALGTLRFLVVHQITLFLDKDGAHAWCLGDIHRVAFYAAVFGGLAVADIVSAVFIQALVVDVDDVAPFISYRTPEVGRLTRCV